MGGGASKANPAQLLYDAAGPGKTANSFKAKLERATDAQVSYRDKGGQSVLIKMVNLMAISKK